MTSIHLLEASGAPAFTYIVARRLDYCTQEAILSQSAARCSLHNSVKLCLHSLELNLVFFFWRHPGGVDLTVTERFSWNLH